MDRCDDGEIQDWENLAETLAAENEKLKASLARETKERKEAQSDRRKEHNLRVKIQGNLDAVLDALRYYGIHLNECEFDEGGAESPHNKCTCGLNDVIFRGKNPPKPGD